MATLNLESSSSSSSATTNPPGVPHFHHTPYYWYVYIYICIYFSGFALSTLLRFVLFSVLQSPFFLFFIFFFWVLFVCAVYWFPLFAVYCSGSIFELVYEINWLHFCNFVVNFLLISYYWKFALLFWYLWISLWINWLHYCNLCGHFFAD